MYVVLRYFFRRIDPKREPMGGFLRASDQNAPLEHSIRSLSYLCREFDSLDHGDDYENVQPVYQIGFLGFNLFVDHPEFCSWYQMIR